ncbi:MULTISPECIES: hypothetical protein [unclassified Streptomyces]|uniref:hypothetical protein n=1 Tax=unclassified Streptomyces TaxID=2593676 RepID=UPI001CD4481B|nr:hypothetical protein [Streptomyces sp. CoH27]
MNPPTQQEWEAAALRLFEDEYAFVATGPRDHTDWRTDVLAVMARSCGDPRGWVTLDWDSEENAADPERGHSFPFVVSTESGLGDILHEVAPESAAQLLVALTDEWFQVKNIPDFSDRREALLSDARTLLSRYSPGCTFHTTAGNASGDPNADFFHSVTGGLGVTDYMSDLGLIAVSSAEVGVFWRFNTY